jgi:hypothetical protein
MRYFFVSYWHPNGYGNITLSIEEYPSLTALEQTVRDEDETITDVVILNIQELTEVDFNNLVS